MKLVITLVIVLGLALGGAILIKNPTIEYVNQSPEVIEKTIEVPQLENRILDAIKASSTAIEEEAQKAYDEKKTQMEKEIELAVTRAYREEIEAREIALVRKDSFELSRKFWEIQSLNVILSLGALSVYLILCTFMNSFLF